MDLGCTTITLHPEVMDVLFKHYQSLRRLFYDVLGHLEIDYMSVALLNPKNELLFLSSRPSIERNLIDNKLWAFDASLHNDFFLQGKARVWDELYQDEWRKPLWEYKQKSHGYSMGISIPSTFEEYRVVYSFALKSTEERIKNKVINKIETLTSMGRFCLKNIMQHIELPGRHIKKPSLKLVINNKVNHAKTP